MTHLRFSLLTTQRSGSTVFWRGLDQHPQIRAFGEVLLYDSVQHADSYHAFHKQSEFRELDLREAARHLIPAYFEQLLAPRPGVRASGFKLMEGQIWPEVEDWLEKERPRIVHMVRRNFLKQHVSRVSAAKRKVYHLRSEKDAITPTTVQLDTENLVRQLTHIKESVQRAHEIAERFESTAIYYEDFLVDAQQVFRSVFGFLGVDAEFEVDLPLQKINPDDLSQIVENWQDVRATLRGTEFEPLLES